MAGTFRSRWLDTARGCRRIFAGHLGRSPVEHERLAELAEHHVLGLQIPVHHSVRMCESHRLANALEHA